MTTSTDWEAVKKRSQAARDAHEYLKEVLSVREGRDAEYHTFRNMMIEEHSTEEEFLKWLKEEREWDRRQATQYKDWTQLTATDEEGLKMFRSLRALRENPYSRDQISHLAISMSLCPVHFLDWAICFDDQPADCEQVRAIFPYSHDT